MVFTKAEIMYDFAKDVIRQYTIYAIVRENFESKDFNQSMWEIWEAIEILYNTELKENQLKEVIKELSEKIVNRYWEYIDALIQEIMKDYQTQEGRDAVDSCLAKIETMKQMGIVDITALKEIRQLEELVY